jgi:beta-lactamase class A
MGAKAKIILIWLAILAAGFLCGFFYCRYFDTYQIKKTLSDVQFVRLENPNFVFIKPLLTVKYGDQKDFFEFAPLQKKIDDEINSIEKEKTVESVSLYFRDLNDGHWVGVNEDTKFNPASLFKIPLMIAYLKNAETDPSVLSKKLYYSESGSTVLKTGTSYSVDELIRYMIIYSDNAAKKLLANNIQYKALSDVYSDLGLSGKESDIEKISARSYSLFFRVLYNASYLNQEMSERALKLLNETEYKEGLVAGTPTGVNVSHKFGEFGQMENGKLVSLEFHDCGIIYKPEHNFFLCVMTKGNNTQVMGQTISNLTKLIYNSL